ncbi:lamin tail domain-containing protein [Brachybacterium sp. AOP25-B2-12]|uniref:lamin tail domain-containing protein n=1 Tax=Brachybacterium sp. AOP25-B2-12 TaxID=3457710 RepID=UPI00403338BF
MRPHTSSSSAPRSRRLPAALAAGGVLTVGLAAAGVWTLPAALAAPTGVSPVHISEVQVNGTDWVELVNSGTEAVDISGWVVRDDKDKDTWTVPSGTSIAPGAYDVIDGEGVPGGLTFGLGKADQVRVFLPDGSTAVGSVAWETARETSWIVCGGRLVASAALTRGAANTCPDATTAPTGTATTAAPTESPTTSGPTDAPSTTAAPTSAASSPLVISEIASQGTDFIELHNTGTTVVDAGGYVLKDSEDDHAFTIPAGTSVPADGYVVFDALGFGLGNPDQARLFTPDGVLVSELSWQDHVRSSLGLCDGKPVQQTTATPGAANDCAAAPEGTGEPTAPATQVATVGGTVVADHADEWPGDLSGLDLQGEGSGQILWGVDNTTGQLSKLRRDGGQGPWVQSPGWPTGGAQLRFADGTGQPDAEGVSVAEDGAIYVAAERDNTKKDTSRNTILRYDPQATATELTATAQWDLTGVIPATAPNGGIEAVEIVPASAFAHLPRTAAPAARAAAAAPVAHAFVAVEDTGDVLALDLLPEGAAVLVATLDSPLPGLMALDHDPSTGVLWAFCDEVCHGQSVRYDLNAADVVAGGVLARPDGMPDVANEGVALEPSTQCTDGSRAAWFADDNDTDGHSLRGTRLTVDCAEGSSGGTDGDGEGTPSATPSGDAATPTGSGATDTGTTSGAAGVPSASGSTASRAAAVASGRGALPRTGLEVAPYVVGALALIAAGGYLVRRARAASERG